MAEEKHYYWLYALRLNNGKYYVGQTRYYNVQTRIDQHKKGWYSADWVKKHGFLEEIEHIDIGLLTNDEAQKQETELTLKYMKKYGYRNVRGGDYSYSGDYFKIGKKLYTDLQMALFIMTLSTISLAILAWK